MDDLDFCLEILKALDISEVVYHLDGSGDSGTSQIESVTYRDGRTATSLPTATIAFHESGGALSTLDDCLDSHAREMPEGDWINNEGGQGTVTLRPFEDDRALQIDCAMTYNDDYDGESDFDDEEDFDEPNAYDERLADSDNAADTPLPTIDDSALTRISGDRP